MKRMLKGYLSLIALFSACAFMGTTSPRIMIRSQSVDAARELVGWAHQVNLFDVGCLYGTFAITPEYTRSFKNCRLASNLFDGLISNNGNCGTLCSPSCFTACNTDCDTDCASFRVTGSCVANRQACDLLAENFGLPADFSSTVTVAPRIENFLVDFDLYLGLDEWLCGLWFRVHAPVVWARWKLNMNECITNAGTLAHPAGYFAPVAIPRTSLLPSFSSYLAGNVPNFSGTGVTFQPLTNSLISNCGVTNSCTTNCFDNNNCGNGSRLTTTKLSDIQFALGWNFWQCDDYHVGLGVRFVAPTGTRIGKCPTLFQPIIGNGHHWEAGAMFTSHYTFWRGCDYDQSFGLYVDLNITHLFKTRQCRTFDLCGAGPLSRYMLAQQLTTNTINLNGNPSTAIGGVAPGANYTASNAQFANVFTPVANLTTATVKVSIPYQVDFVAMFNYQHCNFEWDFGYNLWAVGCEKFSSCSRNCPNGTINGIVPTNWALKGDAFVYGFADTNAAHPLAATQSFASIHGGTNGCFQTNANLGNPRIDNGLFAYIGSSAAGLELYTFPSTVAAQGTAANPQTRTSIQPVLLSDASLNINGARAKGLTHKVFTHFSYTWDCECWMPYLGIGGKAEFSQNRRNDCAVACCTSPVVTSPSTVNCGTLNNCGSSCDNGSNCLRTSISEWGIWLKGGVAFN